MTEDHKAGKLYSIGPLTTEMLAQDPEYAWSPMWVKLNTLATLFAAFTGLVALVIAVIALTS